MNKADKERMSNIANLSCIVCRLFYSVETPAELHHLIGLKYRSTGKKAKEYIPLCPLHHRVGTKDHPSIHAYPKLFAKMYGTQEELLDITNGLIK